MCVVCVDVTEGYSGDGCVLASTLCKYDLRKGDLFVLRTHCVLITAVSNQIPLILNVKKIYI